MVKFALNFCYCAVDQEKAVFKKKRVVSRPSTLLGPEMIKFALNFCYCAVDQEKAVFTKKRTVSCPSALLRPEMVKSALNFCYCAVDQEKAVFTRKRAVSGPSAFLAPEMARKGQNLPGSSQKRARTCLGEIAECLELVWEKPPRKTVFRPLQGLLRLAARGLSRMSDAQIWSGSSQNWSGLSRRFLVERVP